MFPYIDPYGDRGRQMSTVEHPDDIAGISNLYPTAAYRAGTGTISGTLRLKDGHAVRRHQHRRAQRRRPDQRRRLGDDRR